MPRIRRDSPPPIEAPEDAGFGGGESGEIPAYQALPLEEDAPDPPDPDIVALGPPPEDAAGIQKWNYRMLSIMAYKVAINPKLSEEKRMKRTAALTQAAARHYPEAARRDLADRIARDAEEIQGRKRAKAAAKLEKAPPAGGAKIIPMRRGA